LKNFLYGVRESLEIAMNKTLPPMANKGELPQDLYELLRDAWKELGGRFDEISKKLDEVKIDVLEKAGLAGVQLHLKMRAFYMLFEDFSKSSSGQNLKKLLKIIGTIWESISDVLKLPDIMHAIKEFLGVLEAVLP
jgi:hypothetical protein